MGASHIVNTRSESPTQHQNNMVFGQQQQSADQFGLSSQQSFMNNGTTGNSIDFSGFMEGDLQSPVGPFDGPYRNNSVLGSYLGGRTRQNTIQSSSSFLNDTASGTFSPFNSTHGESLGPQSMQLQQQQQNGMRGYDFVNEQVLKGVSKPIFTNMDPFGAGGGMSNSSIMQAQHVNKLLQAQQQLHSFQGSSSAMNSLAQSQSHSQTPFGPHITPNSGGMSMGSVSITSNQEEISTIFVVGFPEDMQEREFQNMFTFSSGFEAATLKIPNKDLTAYSAPPPPGSVSNRNGVGSYGLGYPYTGANDPYNLVTVNQGGVVVDARDGTTTSWPSADPDLTSGLGAGSNPNGGQNGPVPPRKQIIGFAKFRSRAEALAARDLLQGRRVDIEKGAVLKAEMAKKNLHTKRGVGPLSVPLGGNGSNGNPGGAVNGTGMNGGVNGLPDGMTSVTSMLSPVTGPGGEVLSARDRELGVAGAMGLGALARRERDRYDIQEEDREVRRRRETLGSISVVGMQPSSNGGMFGPRGARERLEEDERERKRMERDSIIALERASGRLRSAVSPGSATYDAFQSALQARNGSMSAMLSPTSESGYGSGGTYSAYPFTPQEGSGLESWPPAPQSAGATMGPRANFGSLNLNGALHSLSITSSKNGSTGTSTGGIPTRPSSSHGSTSSDDHVDSFMAGNTTIRAPFPSSTESFTGLSQDNVVERDTPTHVPPFSAPLPETLTSHSSMSSLHSRSRPLSPVLDSGIAVSAASDTSFFPPAMDLKQQLNAQNQSRYASSFLSKTSSASVSSRSNSGSDDEKEMSRALGAVDINSAQGTVSPQLPSPNSGSGSSIGAKGMNSSDQNPPINTLYVGNLPTSPPPGSPPNRLEEGLRHIFTLCPGYRKLCFRQKSNGPMCFVEFEDVQHAAKAMNELYGHQLGGLVKGGIRLSYSKNPLGVRTPTNGSSGNLFQQQGGMQSFASSSSYNNMQDAFSSRHSVPGILHMETGNLRYGRREQNDAGSPSYSFTTSPPPRFFSPDSTGFGSMTSHAGQTHDMQRSASQSFSSSFSPFGSSTPPNMTPQAEALDPLSLKGSLSSSPSLDNA